MPANPTWRQSKEAYLGKISKLTEEFVLIIACEELHDGRELAHDLKNYGRKTLERYPVPHPDVFWYYQSLADIFAKTNISAALKNSFQTMLLDLILELEGK